MFKKILILIFSAVSAILVSCSNVISVSPSTTPIAEDDTYTIIGHAKGSSSSYLIMGVIPITGSDPSRKAVEDALKHSGGNAMIEVVEESGFTSLLILNIYTTNVEGTAVQLERKGGIIE